MPPSPVECRYLKPPTPRSRAPLLLDAAAGHPSPFEATASQVRIQGNRTAGGRDLPVSGLHFTGKKQPLRLAANRRSIRLSCALAVPARSPQTLRIFLGSLAWLALGCGDGGAAPGPADAAISDVTDSAPPICSQMHRDVSRWQGTEIADCGPDVSGLLELTPLGDDWLLARRRFSPLDELWSLSAQGAPGAEPTSVDQVMGAATAGFTLLPGSPPRVLVSDPRTSQWNLYVTESSPVTGAILGIAGQGQW